MLAVFLDAIQLKNNLAPLELSKVAYFMATNSLLITTFCLEMRSEIVAATCIYLAFKWSEFEVGLSTDGRVSWGLLGFFIYFLEVLYRLRGPLIIFCPFFSQIFYIIGNQLIRLSS
jgi:hypothetical protein